MTTKLLLMIYAFCWHIFALYSNANNMKYMHRLHIFWYNVMTTSFRMVYTLHWYIVAICSSTSYSESVYCLHKFHPENEKIIDSVASFFHDALSRKSHGL